MTIQTAPAAGVKSAIGPAYIIQLRNVLIVIALAWLLGHWICAAHARSVSRRTAGREASPFARATRWRSVASAIDVQCDTVE